MGYRDSQFASRSFKEGTDVNPPSDIQPGTQEYEARQLARCIRVFIQASQSPSERRNGSDSFIGSRNNAAVQDSMIELWGMGDAVQPYDLQYVGRYLSSMGLLALNEVY